MRDNFLLFKVKYLTTIKKILANNKQIVPLTQSQLSALEYVCSRVGENGRAEQVEIVL